MCDYVASNQEFALETMSHTISDEMDLERLTKEIDGVMYPDGIPDFGQTIQSIYLNNYPELVQ